jgi:hypothetical protein
MQEEELRMTFQVGLVGRDCLLLGSDRKQRVTPTIFRVEEQYSEFIGQQKMKVNSERTIAVACSGSDVVWESAEKVLSAEGATSTSAEWLEKMIKIGESRPATSWRDKILVLRSGHAGEFIRIDMGERTLEIKDKITSGLPLAATYFLKRYYRQSLRFEALRKLALLVLDCGAQESPENVGYGYDLLAIRNGTIQPVETVQEDSHEIIEIRSRMESAIKDILLREH